MNRLEEAVRPFLCSMISGKSNVVLDEHKATSLTAWIYKIMLLFDLSGPAEYRRFRRAHYQSFYEEQKPSSDTRIWRNPNASDPAGVRSEMHIKLRAT